LSTTALAHADRPLSNSYCKGPVAVAPDISATTCVYVTVSDAVYTSAGVTVYNNSPYTVTARADLLAGSSTYLGNVGTIVPHGTGGASTNTVVNPPAQGADLIGRGYLQTANWSTYPFNK
jgi:hypothetical protein